jgi:hypothetical protein
VRRFLKRPVDLTGELSLKRFILFREDVPPRPEMTDVHLVQGSDHIDGMSRKEPNSRSRPGILLPGPRAALGAAIKPRSTSGFSTISTEEAP